MNVVMTGATSFMGAPMADQLLREGHQVFALVRPGSKNLGRLKSLGPGLHVLPMELGEMDQLGQVAGVPCQAFIHFGWEGAGSHNRTCRQVQQKNVEYSMKALCAARDLGCGRFLFSGSQAEYGICQEAMTEETACRPVSEYGKAKAEFGEMAMEAVKSWRSQGSGMAYLHARIFSVYGPGDHPWSLVESCLKAFAQGQDMELGECGQLWNFLYIDDLVEACMALACQEGLPEGFYNIAGGPGQTRPLKEYVKELHQLCGGRGSCQFGVRPPNAEGAANLVPDISKITRLTGWKPKTSFSDGIKQMRKNPKYKERG